MSIAAAAAAAAAAAPSFSSSAPERRSARASLALPTAGISLARPVASRRAHPLPAPGSVAPCRCRARPGPKPVSSPQKPAWNRASPLHPLPAFLCRPPLPFTPFRPPRPRLPDPVGPGPISARQARLGPVDPTRSPKPRGRDDQKRAAGCQRVGARKNPARADGPGPARVRRGPGRRGRGRGACTRPSRRRTWRRTCGRPASP